MDNDDEQEDIFGQDSDDDFQNQNYDDNAEDNNVNDEDDNEEDEEEEEEEEVDVKKDETNVNPSSSSSSSNNNNNNNNSSNPDITSKKRSADEASKPSKKRREEKKSKSKTKLKVRNFFDDEAQEDEDEDEEEYEASKLRDSQEEEFIGEAERAAIEAVTRRHASNRERHSMDAATLAAEYEERARHQATIEKMKYTSEGGLPGGQRVSSVVQQSLLPSVNDPGIWRCKVATGLEQQLVISIMRKAIDSKLKGGPLRLKSAFCSGSKGYIYIEAIAEPLAREAILGLRGVYQSSLTKVPIREMTSVITVLKVSKKPLLINQWVRLSRGPLKGDLAKIVSIYEGGGKVMIQAVPRPDYTTNNNNNNNTDMDNKNKKGNKNIPSNSLAKIRPSRRLFDLVEARNSGGDCFRKYHPLDRTGEKYDFYNNEYYRDGYLYKDVNPDTYLHVNNIIPQMEEAKLFLIQKKSSRHQNKGDVYDEDRNEDDMDNDEDNIDEEDDDDDDDDEEEDDEDEEDGDDDEQEVEVVEVDEVTGESITVLKKQSSLKSSSSSSSAIIKKKKKKKGSFVKELAEQLMGTDLSLTQNGGGITVSDSISAASVTTNTTSKIPLYTAGDLVQVMSGELMNLVARIISINTITQTVNVIPYNSVLLTGEFTIETSVLMKYIPPGSHVKIINGMFTGQTGRVVSIKILDGKPTVVILTDGVNSEILVDVISVQLSNEVTSGLGNLMGYELYDLVVLNENESAVVIAVGAEKLKLINHLDIVKEVFPQEIQAKRNTQSQRSKGFDSQQHAVSVGDVVNVISGNHAKSTGTVRHIMKGSFWLHSNMHLKNSGIFVIRGRCCSVAGIKPSDNHNTTGNNNNMMMNQSGKPIMLKKGGKDESIGKTLRITKGQYKGHLAQIVDVVNDSYFVELLSKMKKITIEKSKTVLVGDKEGSFTSDKRNTGGGGGGAGGISGGTAGGGYDGNGVIPSTPFYSQETPHHYAGVATPHHYSSSTPSRDQGGMTPGRTPNPYAEREEDSRIWSAESNYNAANVDDTMNNNTTITSSSGSIPNTISDSSINHWDTIDSVVSGSSSSSNNTAMSPYSPAPSTATSGTSGVSWKDWVVGMIVVFKVGAYAGKQGFIKDLSNLTNNNTTSSTGNEKDMKMTVQLRNDKGFAYGGDFEVMMSECSIAEPVKKSKVYIMAGNGRGKRGVVKAIAGKDVILETNEMYKLQFVAMMRD